MCPHGMQGGAVRVVTDTARRPQPSDRGAGRVLGYERRDTPLKAHVVKAGVCGLYCTTLGTAVAAVTAVCYTTRGYGD